MSEIEKMYENVGINQACNTCELRGFKRLCPTKELCVRTNPKFTAEKQIELIKWACQTRDFAFEGIFINNTYYLSCRHTININTGKYYISNIENEKFEDAIAGLINSLWQDLTEEERKQVKEILE